MQLNFTQTKIIYLQNHKEQQWILTFYILSLILV